METTNIGHGGEQRKTGDVKRTHVRLAGVELPLRSAPSSSSVAEYSEPECMLKSRRRSRFSLKLDQPLNTACSSTLGAQAVKQCASAMAPAPTTWAANLTGKHSLWRLDSTPGAAAGDLTAVSLES